METAECWEERCLKSTQRGGKVEGGGVGVRPVKMGRFVTCIGPGKEMKCSKGERLVLQFA